MTANFLDLMIINADTISFLLAVKPDLLREAVLALVLIIPALALLWRIDSFRMRPRTRGDGISRVLRRAPRHRAGGRAGGLGDVRRQQLCVQVLALGRCRDLRPDDPRIPGIRGDAHRAAEDAPGGHLHAERKAAAHHSGARRVELRHPGRARRQGSAGLRRPLPVVRRQGGATSSPKAPAGRAGTPSTTCSPACPRARLAASPIT